MCKTKALKGALGVQTGGLMLKTDILNYYDRTVFWWAGWCSGNKIASHELGSGSNLLS